MKPAPSTHPSADPERIIPDDWIVESLEDVHRILNDLDFAPSCVDMSWCWEAEKMYVAGEGNYGFGGAGYRLRTPFLRPDRDALPGEQPARGWGRWHEVPLNVTLSGVVKTCFVAAKMILEHELMESFKWRGQRIFDPHNTVEELASLNIRRFVRSTP